MKVTKIEEKEERIEKYDRLLEETWRCVSALTEGLSTYASKGEVTITVFADGEIVKITEDF